MKHIKYKILLALFLISLISSLVLSIIPVPTICDPGVGCDVVHYSVYNFTFGVQNSYYGVVIFGFLVTLTALQIKKPSKEKKLLIHLAVILGSIISIYFLYIQHFVLNTYCRYCLIVDFSMLVSLAVILIKWKE